MSLAATGRARAAGAAMVGFACAVAASLASSGPLGAQMQAPAERGGGTRPAAGSTGAATPAPAGTSAAPATGGDGAVEITVVGTTGDLQRVRGAIESRSPAGSAARWTRVPAFEPMEILRGDRESQSATLRCWIDVVDPRRARLYFAARSGQQFLVRDVELSGTFDEVDREALSQVVELSVAALLENERAGLTRAQAQALLAGREPRPPRPLAETPPAPAPAPVAAPAPAVVAPPPPVGQADLSRPAGLGPTAAAFYRAQVLGGDLPVVHGPGARLAWGGLGPRAALGAWASGQYQFSEDEIGPAIGMRFQTIAARAGAEGRLPFGAGRAGAPERPGTFTGFTARLGAGVDVVRLRPLPGSADPSATLTPARWSQSAVLGAAVTATFTLGRRLVLAAVVSVDVLPTAVHYDLAMAGQTSAAFSPWRARPGLALELGLR